MAALLKGWREAATLIVTTSSKLARGTIIPQLTSTNSSVTSASALKDPIDNFDVLLLKRSSKSKFMPNMHVFPGGAAVDNDFSTKWISVFCKLGIDVQQNLFKKLSAGTGAPMFSRQREPHFSNIPAEIAFRICAIRETFEESGVLLALPIEESKNKVNLVFSEHGTPELSVLHEDCTTLNVWRTRVNKDPDEFLNMCLELDLIPEIWALYEWSNWLTPASEADSRHRFDTAFFVCCVDCKPDAVHDAGETVSTLWSSPSSLLTAYFQQKGGLAPPQFYELSRLLNFKSASDIVKFVAQPNCLRVVRFLPVLVMTKDHYFSVLPGDDLYPKEIDPDSKIISEKYDMSLDELSKKYHNHNKLFIGDSQHLCDVQCTLQPHNGCVHPDTSILNSIRIRAKL